MPKMSLLNKVFEAYNAHRVAFSQTEAIAAIAVSAIASDGYLLEQETERVIVLLSQMEMFKGYSEKQITNMLNRLLNTLSEKGINNLVATANDSLHPEYKETAFMLATDIILVDGVLSGKEQTFLTRLYQVLEISTETASAIFQTKSEIHQVTKKKSKKYRINQNPEK
ncbi:MAG: tellurite resistance TerB family protein [Okeania sp. SIO2F4]|uniref:tellurite resistance TerB family protein n=1 Tax=Okeania sp. SIO2F4 TaxID=2607790 RepID=UPI00142C1C60|nr:tellurite resistance TerB family protein [Okeania sp. SIO2F4]NES06415.1 tellurite resistance TerB family protein [Okeania sp. SIO2F4]